MLSVQDAEALILDLVQPFQAEQDTESLALLTAAGRILAAPLGSSLDFPHWDNSAMDGYAVRYADVQNCDAENPAILAVVEEIPAGIMPQRSLQPSQAARIFTGAMLPLGADTVIMQERTVRQDDQVQILAAPTQLGDFVRYRGEFYRAGSPLLQPGMRLSATEIAILAAAQCRQVTVYRQPRVAILSTGDELVSLDQPLQPGQIVDSNAYALSTLVAQLGAEPMWLGIVPDQPEALKKAIAQALTTADVILSSGGVSVGDYDYVDQILATLGAEIHIRAIAVKPGKPLTTATFDRANAPPCLYFGLPGNPVSALVTFWRFVQPALRKLSGQAPPWTPTVVPARSRQLLKSDGQRETYLWGRLQLMQGRYEFELAVGHHSSGNLINLAQTNGLAILAVGQTAIAAGETVQVMQIN